MGYHTEPPIIVSEFMQRGSLQTYLRRRQVSDWFIASAFSFAPPTGLKNSSLSGLC